MARQSRLFPAWALPSQDYHKALARRLPKAIAAMRDEHYRDLAQWMLYAEYLQQLEQVLRNPSQHWTKHVRRSKNGKETNVWSPTKALRDLQSDAYLVFFPLADNHAVATAFGLGCSVVANAKLHQNGRSSFRIDIQDAFPSIRTNDISAYLVRHGVDEDLAWVLARLWTYRGRLEQGAPVAPKIFNALLARLDTDLLAEIGPDIVYTRYGDDMCFSCALSEFPAELEERIRVVVQRHHFRINAKKTRRGRDGIVDLPGIAIKQGRIRPNGAYRKKIQESWQFLLPKQIAGHRAYVSSFGHSGDLRVLRPLIGEHTKSQRQRDEEKLRRLRERKRSKRPKTTREPD